MKEITIEKELINILTDRLKYTFRPDITDRKTLEKNFREKFNTLNKVNLSDKEFEQLKMDIISSDVFIASKKLREKQYFQREDGTPLIYTLLNIKDWCKNDYEVIHQLRINTENGHQRYDVILLINGLPLVQIELKNIEISPRKAMQQIVNYKNEPGNGYGNSLLCFMQLFIVSNFTNTYYFANNQNQHFKFNAEEQFLPIYQLADDENKKIVHLTDFSNKFLAKCTLGELISKYMVLVESEQKILIMRPYQIYAVKAIVDCIEQNRGNGYIWHTTGSGKTLTSFKASTLLKENSDIDKCLFVVDRKDLDRQTREEFNRFQEGSVEENTNTTTLVSRLLSTDYADKVIVTTIQKLGLALGTQSYIERLKTLRNKRFVFIFDECHRSQFGENHKAIKDFFPKAQLFGFTGTPIFEDNATYNTREGKEAKYKTTESIFEKELHAYTITEAIDDRNVLKFHIDYYKSNNKENIKSDGNIVQQAVVESILEKHNAATNSRKFNALFATASINNAIEYYRLFKELQAKKQTECLEFQPLNIACVFSPPAEGNKDVLQIQEDLPQEKEDNTQNPTEKKQALTEIISDYNTQYGTNHSVSEFDVYYQDVQKRIKDQKYNNKDYPQHNKIDITIVVDMLLTGFDSKYLNTLYVDKNLKYHGLIQAFSRTNRVLNDSKPYGNILDFRSQQQKVNEAIMLFSGKDKERVQEVWLVPSADEVLEKYKNAFVSLESFMKSHHLETKPEDVFSLKGDTARIDFINNFKEVQRLRTELDQYTDLTEEQKAEIEAILPKEAFQSFRSSYLETAKQLRTKQQKEGEKASVELQQLDFEFVLFASAIIDYDYIMQLVAESSGKIDKKGLTKEDIKKLLKSNSNLMEDEKDLSAFIDSLDWSKGYSTAFLKESYEAFKNEKYDKELILIAEKHGLEKQSLKAFVENILLRMIFDGELLTDLFEPLDLNWKERRIRELALMDELGPHLKKVVGGRTISGLNAWEE